MKKNTLSLKAIFVYAMRKWVICLVLALVCALALGGRQFLKLQKRANAAQAAAAAAAADEANEDADSTSGEVEVHADYNQNADMLLKMIEKKSDYLNNSIFAGLDPYNEGVALVDMTIMTEALESEDAGYDNVTVVTLDTEKFDSTSGDTIESQEMVAISPAEIEAAEILRHYTQYIQYELEWTELAEELETEPKYLQEIVSIENGNTANVAVIKVYHNDEEKAVEIRDYIVEQLETYIPQAKAALAEHEISFDNEVSSTIVDSDMFRFLNVRASEINTMLTTMNSLKTGTSNLGSSSSGSGTVAQISRSAMLKGSVKHAIVGFAGGIILYMALVFLYILLTGIVISGKQLNDLYDLKKLAVVSNRKGKKRGLIDLLFDGDEVAYCSGRSVEDGYKIAAENLRESAKDDVIAIVGDASAATMQAVKDGMTANGIDAEHIRVLENLNDSSADIAELKNAAGAVLVAEVNKSRYADLERLMETVDLHKKNVIGSIILE